MQWLASTSPWLLLFAAAGQAQPTSAQVLAVAPDEDVTQSELGVSDERIASEAQQCRYELEVVEEKMK
jgi:hypothetical protein